MSRPMSKTAKLQADRAIRKLVREFTESGIGTRQANGDPSEALQEATYEEAAARNVYQSEEWIEEWLDWRSYVERGVLEQMPAPSRVRSLPTPDNRTQPVTIRHTAHAHYAPSLGIGGTTYTPDVTTITTHIDGESIMIVDRQVTSRVHSLAGGLVSIDMSDLTPGELVTHDEIAGYWFAVARGWADAASELEREVA